MEIPEDEYRNIMDKTVILCVDAIIVSEDGRYLLIKRKNEPLKDEWWIIGGRMHKGETAHQAVVRKVKEEVGLDVEVIEELGYYDEHFDKNPFDLDSGVHTISLVFLVRPTNYDVVLDSQSSEWKWAKDVPEKVVVQVFEQKGNHK